MVADIAESTARSQAEQAQALANQQGKVVVEQAEARIAGFHFIEGFYNPTRRHSALGCLSPIEYEAYKKLMND